MPEGKGVLRNSDAKPQVRSRKDRMYLLTSLQNSERPWPWENPERGWLLGRGVESSGPRIP